jgi:hypothetical protein
MQGGHRFVRLLAPLLVAISLLAGHAVADTRIGALTKTLATSSSDKARIAAVAALARLNDRTAMKPLVGALTDPNPQVRALAAGALGRLGHKAALPALKTAADDSDPIVSARAKEAAIAVAKANKLPAPWPVAVVAVAKPQARKHGGRAGFGRQSHAVENHPDLYVTINSSADDSPGKADKATRKVHSELLKQTLSASFKANPMVTSIEADAQRWGLDPRHLDLSVVKLDVAQAGQYIEIEAQLRLAISDDKGKMLSFVSGGAKVQIPKRTFNARYLPSLRKEAIENAMRGMFDKLLMQLRDKSQS